MGMGRFDWVTGSVEQSCDAKIRRLRASKRALPPGGRRILRQFGAGRSCRARARGTTDVTLPEFFG